MPGFKIDGNGGDLSNTVETARTHRWKITKLGPISRDSLLFAKELNLPQFSVEQLTIMAGTLNYKFAKNIKWEDVTITFYDYQGLYDEILKWRELVYNDEDGIGKHSPTGDQSYKQVSKFEELDGNGDTIKFVWLYNSWPSKIDYGKLSYTNNDIKNIILTLSYDHADIYDA